MSEIAIAAEHLEKHYGKVVALAGVSLEVPRRPSSVCSARTAPARRPRCGSSPPTCGPTRAGPRCSVSTSWRIPQAVRERIGLAGQYAAVDDNLTGRENLRLVGYLTHQPRKLAGARADELLEQFGLTDAANRTAKTYSGGMRRRLDLAASLVHRPPVLFLDEPTTGLDPASRTDLWGVIEAARRAAARRCCSRRSTSRRPTASPNRIMVIDGGRTIAEGTPAELKQHYGATVVEITLAPDDVRPRRAAARAARQDGTHRRRDARRDHRRRRAAARSRWCGRSTGSP